MEEKTITVTHTGTLSSGKEITIKNTYPNKSRKEREEGYIEAIKRFRRSTEKIKNT